MANDELRVTVRLGLTIPTGDYGNIKPEVELVNLDPAGDVAAQIAEGLEAAASAFVEIDGRLADTIGRLVEAVQLARPAEVQRLDVVQNQVGEITKTLNALIERLREQATADSLEAAVASRETS